MGFASATGPSNMKIEASERLEIFVSANRLDEDGREIGINSTLVKKNRTYYAYAQNARRDDSSSKPKLLGRVLREKSFKDYHAATEWLHTTVGELCSKLK